MVCDQQYDGGSRTIQCSVELARVYQAIIDLSLGRLAVTVRGKGNREVTFANTDIEHLRGVYQMLYAECGANSDLPDPSKLPKPGGNVTRGAPIKVGFVRNVP